MAKRKLIAEYNVFLTDDGRLEIDYKDTDKADRLWIAQKVRAFADWQIKDYVRRLGEEAE